MRFGFNIGGVIVYCHQMLNANSVAGVYMTTATLPLRYSLQMTSATTTTDLYEICQSVASEGGVDEDRGYPFTANNGITAVAVTTRRPVLSIRPLLTFNSIPNRGAVIPLEVDAAVNNNDSLCEVVYRGTLTGASFAAVDATNSITERDVSATAISGGTVIASFYAPQATGSGAGKSSVSSLQSLLGRIPGLTLDAAGTTADILSLVCTSFTGTADVTGAMNWREVR